MNAKKQQERRACERVSVNENILTIHANKPGRIVDVSESGISFEYLDGEVWPEGKLTLDVLYGEKDFYLDMLPVETVSESQARALRSQRVRKTGRRRSLQFGELSVAQKRQLSNFLKVNSRCKNQMHRR